MQLNYLKQAYKKAQVWRVLVVLFAKNSKPEHWGPLLN